MAIRSNPPRNRAIVPSTSALCVCTRFSLILFGSMSQLSFVRSHCVDLFGVTERTVYEDRLHVVVAVTSICFIFEFRERIKSVSIYSVCVCV